MDKRINKLDKYRALELYGMLIIIYVLLYLANLKLGTFSLSFSTFFIWNILKVSFGTML